VRAVVGAVLVVATLCMAGAAFADVTGGASASGETVVKRGDRGPAVKRVQRALRVTPLDGVFGPVTERSVRRFQREKGLVADGIVGPVTRRALGLEPFRSSSLRRRVRLPRALVEIAECESGGNPRAVSRRGLHRGKYQFTRATWRQLGGEGDPAEAPEWLQDRIALALYRRSGTAPWPNCA
jgi:peptidoglycan hydrolase-like protein with peptidoglycan-binding domain